MSDLDVLREDFKRRFAGTGSIDAAWDYVFGSPDLLPNEKKVQRRAQMLEGIGNLYTELADMVNAGKESVDPKHVLAKVESLVELADWERERT